ncbi:MAG: DNA-binding NarL/FixJ family response regulator [Crocinitomix sp.]|jgi:DNA-binding NarL/FixJ family response regulator
MIKISIADDHQLFRQGIVALLSTIEGFEVCNQSANGKLLLEYLDKTTTDVVLMDINMPVLDGIACAEIIKQKYSETKIIMLSMHADQETIQKAMKVGIDGYLPKDTGKDELEEAIHKVYSGERYFNAAVTGAVMNGLASKRVAQEVRLTPREKDVLKLICEEFTTREIADKLFIAFNTVETHRKNLLYKTGSKNSLGLLKFAIDNKLFAST